jgi:5-methylcytosine-specific restriction endonuclease McrA
MAPPWASSRRKGRLPADWEARRRRVLHRDGHRCQIAGRDCAGVATEVDHVVPNDDHSLDNLQAACHPCHWAKSQAESAAARLRRARPGERHPGLR